MLKSKNIGNNLLRLIRQIPTTQKKVWTASLPWLSAFEDILITYIHFTIPDTISKCWSTFLQKFFFFFFYRTVMQYDLHIDHGKWDMPIWVSLIIFSTFSVYRSNVFCELFEKVSKKTQYTRYLNLLEI